MTNTDPQKTRALLRLGRLLIAATAICGPARAARADDWGTPGLDAAHSRLSTERSGAAFGSARWSTSFKAGGVVLASPVVADGFVVTVDLDGMVTALRAEDGTPAWQVSVGSAVHGSPAAAHGRVFVPTFGNKITTLRLGDGSALWTADVGGTVLSSPTPVGGDIVVAAGFPQHHVLRLSGQTGAVVWQSPDVMQQFSNTSPAVGGGLVVVGSNGGRYYGFDAASGAMRWEYVADGLVHLAAPIITGGRVFMAGGNDSDHVHAVDAATGTPIPGWPIDLPAPDPDVTGTVLGRHRAISSLVSVAGMLILQTRLDDALDTDGDGVIDDRLSRESVVAIDATTGDQVWQVARGRAEVSDPNDVPKFLVCPTPAAYGTDDGTPLVISASSLGPTIVVLDPATGGQRTNMKVAGATLASPVFANGRLYSVALNGTVEALASSANHAPGAPIPANLSRAADAADLSLHWLPAIDPDGEFPSYELRIDSDGEVLETWQQQIFLPAGTTSVPVSAGLVPGVTYTYAVRARDTHGALSSWSALQSFTVFRNPPVTVGANAAGSLTQALSTAQPGDVIGLVAGTYALAATLHLAGGVSIQGAGAGRTVLDAAGLPVGVSFDGRDANHRMALDGLTVTGADTCINVGAGSTGVTLTHVIVRDCSKVGLAIDAAGGADVTNGTLVGNGTAVAAAGSTRVRNSLITSNAVGLSSGAPGKLTSGYNDVFGNQTDYAGAQPGTGDLSTAVLFADLANRSLRIGAPQPSTDRGDPADPVGEEPTPNGGRINLGAFGGSADAETSALSTPIGGRNAGGVPTTDPGEPGPTSGVTPGSSSGGCAVAATPRSWDWTMLCPLLIVLRRWRRFAAVRQARPGRPLLRASARRSS
jgi:outer membrane protein assembly factor BamB